MFVLSVYCALYELLIILICLQEKRRVEIENKLEQMAVRERQEAAKERQELYDQRKLQRQRVGILTRQLATAEMVNIT